MVTSVPGFLLVHRISIEPYAGNSAYGPVFGVAVAGVRCLVEEQNRLVRASNGDEVVSSTTVYCKPGTAAPAKSRITLPDGRVTTVIARLDRDGKGLGTPNHVELQLV